MPQAPYFKAPRPSPPLAPPPLDPDPLPPYAELHCRSNFSFLVGASHPQEMVARAAQLGYTALAITDECSVAGVVRAHEEAKRQAENGQRLKLIVGAEFVLDDGPRLVDLGLTLAAALAGQGVVLARLSLARHELAEGRLVQPFALTVPAERHYGLAVHRPSAAAEAFAAWLHGHCRALQDGQLENSSAAH